LSSVALRRPGLGEPETFNFLGFTFISGKSRRGHVLIKRKTRRDRMQAKLQEIKKELRERMHQPIPKQGAMVEAVRYGLPTNDCALARFRHHVAAPGFACSGAARETASRGNA
jgi:hypothetical protein